MKITRFASSHSDVETAVRELPGCQAHAHHLDIFHVVQKNLTIDAVIWVTISLIIAQNRE
jgi:hypothetical protein